MKKLIITMQIGDKGRDVWDMLTPYLKRYADRVEADFIIITEPKSEYKELSFYLNKFIMFDYMQKYDKMLFLDSDILINPKAHDIFESYPETDRFYGVDEGYTKRANIVKPYIDKYDVDWKLGDYHTYTHYNGGVWLFGRDCDFTHDLNEYLCIKGYEENFLNYIIQKNKVPNSGMSRVWNKLCSDKTIQRRDAYFIHYAGPGHVDYNHTNEIFEKKRILIKSDIKYFYGDKV